MLSLRRASRRLFAAAGAHPGRTSPMRAFVEVLGPGSADARAGVQLFFDDARYLFECGDGTQRLCTEHGIRLARLRGVYLTSLAAPSIGGLFGMILTIADAGKEHVAVTAPKGLASLFDAALPFFYRPALKSSLCEVEVEAGEPDAVVVTEDENVTISAVPVRYPRDAPRDLAFGAQYDAVTYICRLRDLRGKFNPARALELGVKKGRNFGLLQKGESITTDGGTVVHSADVMSPGTPGPVIVVVGCPTVHHVAGLVNSLALSSVSLGVVSPEALYETPPLRTCVVYHLGPREVLQHPAYQKWTDSFGAHTTHVTLHGSVAPAGAVFASQAEDIALLHYTIDKDMFPLPADSFMPSDTETTNPGALAHEEKSDHAEFVVSHIASRVGKWYTGECRLRFLLAPASSLGIDRIEVRDRFVKRVANQPLRPWKTLKTTAIVPPGNGHGSEEAHAVDMATPDCVASITPGTAAIRFLGTGGAIPGKHRNVSGIMLDLFQRGGVIMDCGEGSWGQMTRAFGQSAAEDALCGLRIIFVSHMHADHHLGLVTLLHERTLALKRRPEYRNGPQLAVIGPRHLRAWLDSFQAVARLPENGSFVAEDSRLSYQFYDAASLTDPQAPEAKIFPDMFGLDVGCVEVVHCPYSYGIVLQDCLSGWKVVYSGDTRPCEALAEAGKGATLAIHEATLDDTMGPEALDKLHSTTSEAVDVCATKMGAWRTILTHFSQRYARIPVLNAEILSKMQNGRAAVAFDLMCVDFAHLQDLPRVMPVLHDTFVDVLPDGDVVEPPCSHSLEDKTRPG